MVHVNEAPATLMVDKCPIYTQASIVSRKGAKTQRSHARVEQLIPNPPSELCELRAFA